MRDHSTLRFADKLEPNWRTLSIATVALGFGLGMAGGAQALRDSWAQESRAPSGASSGGFQPLQLGFAAQQAQADGGLVPPEVGQVAPQGNVRFVQDQPSRQNVARQNAVWQKVNGRDLLQRTDPESVQRDARVQQLAGELRDSLRRSGEDSLDEERLAEFRKLVTEQFEVRQAEQQQRLDRLKVQAAQAEEVLQKRADQKSTIIERRVKELLGQGDPLNWDYNATVPNAPLVADFRFPASMTIPPTQPGGYPNYQNNLPPRSPNLPPGVRPNRLDPRGNGVPSAPSIPGNNFPPSSDPFGGAGSSPAPFGDAANGAANGAAYYDPFGGAASGGAGSGPFDDSAISQGRLSGEARSNESSSPNNNRNFNSGNPGEQWSRQSSVNAGQFNAVAPQAGVQQLVSIAQELAKELAGFAQSKRNYEAGLVPRTEFQKSRFNLSSLVAQLKLAKLEIDATRDRLEGEVESARLGLESAVLERKAQTEPLKDRVAQNKILEADAKVRNVQAALSVVVAQEKILKELVKSLGFDSLDDLQKQVSEALEADSASKAPTAAADAAPAEQAPAEDSKTNGEARNN